MTKKMLKPSNFIWKLLQRYRKLEMGCVLLLNFSVTVKGVLGDLG